MNEELISECRRLLGEYKANETAETRNALFHLLLPFLRRWVKSIAGRRGRHLDEGEVLSLTWDCYYFALGYWRGRDIPRHFYTYARYFLLAHWAKEEKWDYRDFAEGFLYEPVQGTGAGHFSQIADLKAFRDTLSEQSRMIFDDALFSLIPDTRARMNRWKEVGISEYRYYARKEAYRELITYLLV